jgi:hypothetical protein
MVGKSASPTWFSIKLSSYSQVFRDVNGIRWRPMTTYDDPWRPMTTHGPSLSWNSLVTWSGHLPHAPHQRSLEPVTVEERWRREPVLPWSHLSKQGFRYLDEYSEASKMFQVTKKNMKKLATLICYILLLYYAIFIVSRRFPIFMATWRVCSP